MDMEAANGQSEMPQFFTDHRPDRFFLSQPRHRSLLFLAGYLCVPIPLAERREEANMRRASTWLITSTLLLVGCGGPSGGGSATINQHVVAYGIGKAGVSFAIFTDIDALNTQTRSAGKSGMMASQQTGSITPASGTTIEYAASSMSLEIGGREYAFEKGRVFLVTTRGGNLDVRQVDIPIEQTGLSSEALQSEVRRLGENAEVRVLTASPGGEAR